MSQTAVIDTPFAEVHSLEGDPLCSTGEQMHGWTGVNEIGHFYLPESISNHSTLLSWQICALESYHLQFSDSA